MKVLYYHQHFSTPAGATGMRSYAIAKRLVERGHQVTMVCGSYDEGDTGLEGPFIAGQRRGMVDGIAVVQFELPYSNADGFLKRTRTFLQFAARSLGPALSDRYDVLFATSTPLTVAIPGIVGRVFRKRPFVFEVRDLWPELPRAMGVISNPLVLSLMSLLELLAYRTATACVGLSPGIVAGIRARGVNPTRVHMIPNGCDLELFHGGVATRPQLRELHATDLVAAFTGTHGTANGLSAVLEAARVLKARGRHDIKLLFVGSGKLKPQLVDTAREQGLTNCLFHDSMSKNDLAGLLRRVDVGLMILANVPAFYFGTSPNKFFDYIASGLPVLTNYPGWIADIVTSHKCGIAVPPDNPAAFADALERLADNRDELKSMGQRARMVAQRQFDRTELADQLVDLLTDVASRVPGVRSAG